MSFSRLLNGSADIALLSSPTIVGVVVGGGGTALKLPISDNAFDVRATAAAEAEAAQTNIFLKESEQSDPNYLFFCLSNFVKKVRQDTFKEEEKEAEEVEVEEAIIS